MARKSHCLFLLIALLLTSCFKEDEMVTPHPRGNIKTDTIAMTETYLYQLYFSLDSARVVSSNKKIIYDLGFECKTHGGQIILNSSDFAKVSDLGVVPFGVAYDTVGLSWKFDKSDGNPDSNAVGIWYRVAGSDTVSNNHVYLLNRGMDEQGNTLGIVQIIFDSLKSGVYYFRHAPLKGGTVNSGAVAKDPSVSYVYYSIKAGTPIHIEPPKPDFDLLFTQYTTLLYTNEGIPYPYLVTGVLSNRYKVEVAFDSIHEFSAINHDIALTLDYSKALDAIGYDWKYYNFDNGVYTIRPNYSYVVHSVDGFFYKLRFIGFYNRSGQKGYPVIEYQQL